MGRAGYNNSLQEAGVQKIDVTRRKIVGFSVEKIKAMITISEVIVVTSEPLGSMHGISPFS